MGVYWWKIKAGYCVLHQILMHEQTTQPILKYTTSYTFSPLPFFPHLCYIREKNPQMFRTGSTVGPEPNASLPLQVRILFSKGPFISIFASDPHIIIKAINQNLNSVLRDSNINGHDYMRNIVHLPVFLNSRGLSTAKKLSMAALTNRDLLAAEGKQKTMADL